MNLVQYDPWSTFQKLNNEMSTLFNERSFGRSNGNDVSNVVTSAWMPAVDIKEESNRFVLMADIPGVDPKDIDITMENGVLTLKGERSWGDEEQKDSFRRVERAHGVFYRRFSLPDSADAEGIEANDKNGVLTITIPKKEKAQPRRIEVAA